MPALLAAVLSLGAAAVAAPAVASDFEHPASPDTSQQLSPPAPLTAPNVQRQDTPNDPDYDSSEPDTKLSGRTSDLYSERFDLFGFAANLATTANALYLDPTDPRRFGKRQVSGFNAAGAWKIERGRADVTVAVLDTGIKWDRCGLRDKIHLNVGELPLPEGKDGTTDPAAPLGGRDLNHDGVVDVDDYAADPRVQREFPKSCDGQVTAKDLINAFSDHTDADHNGYVDDIAGWNFFDDNNDPTDRSSYFAASNHGSGRASEAVEQGNDGAGSIGVCPHCQLTPIRVWDTFVSDGNTFGLGILYAADNGVSVIEGADGGLYHSAFAEAASRYAYEKGLVETYSGDDLNTGNHNYPANYNHTMLIEGTVPDTAGLGQDFPGGGQLCQFVNKLPGLHLPCPGTNVPVSTYFRGANTTQFGGHSSISMEGPTGSTNTGKAAGAAAIVVSAGRDFSPALPLSADETREILEQTAEDVRAPNTAGVGVPDPAQPGWDEHFGYGRVDLGAAVQAVKDRNIPPEAAIDSPDWYAPLTGASVPITGLARARRAPDGRFHYKLEWGPGLAPTSWQTVPGGEGDASGTRTDLGTLDLTAVRRTLANFHVPLDPAGPTFAPGGRNPFQDQFTVRLTVTDPTHPGGLPGIDRKVLTALPDGQGLRPGFPKRLGTGGEAPLRYADLNGDNVQELVLPTEDGLVHAYEPDGRELRGWPVRTGVQFQAGDHIGAPAFAKGGVAAPHEPPRGPVIADLDGDGKVSVITAAGIHVYAWGPDGKLRRGFPVSSDRSFCRPEDESQPRNHPKCGFLASPAVAHLEGRGKPLDIVEPSLDGHLYAWRGDGSLLPGYPVRLIDPTQPPDKQVVAESINEPAIGDLNGDGVDDVVVATNETYGASSGGGGDVSFGPIGGGLTSETPVYAVNGATGKFLPGWPIHISGVIQNTLPLIGPGHDPSIARLGGKPVVVASATGTGPPGVTGGLATYAADGRKLTTMDQTTRGARSNATDPTPGLNLFESAVVGDLLGDGKLDVVKYQIGLAAAANLALVGQNFPYNHMIGAWSASTGESVPAFPRVTEDFQFLSSSTVAKVDPGRTANQVVAGTALGLLHAYDGATGADAPGFPKVTGGWLFAPAALSDDGRMAAITREGFLFEWGSRATACQPEWPSFRHDPHGSGNYDTDGTPPAAPTGLAVGSASGARRAVRFRSPGDDGFCGTATRYRATLAGRPISLGDPVAGGNGFDRAVTLGALPAGTRATLTVQAVDEAGNVGPPASAIVSAASRTRPAQPGPTGGSGGPKHHRAGNEPAASVRSTGGSGTVRHVANASSGGLPFTGLVLLPLLLAGALMLLGGVALRRRSRRSVS